MKVETRKKAAGKALTKPPLDRMLRSPRAAETKRPRPLHRVQGLRYIPITFGLLVFGVWCLVFAPAARAAYTVTGLVNQVTSAALDTYLMFMPGEDILLLNNGLSAGPAKTILSSNGGFSITLDAGNYLVRLPLVPARAAFTIGVPNGTATANITNLIAQPWTYADFINTASNSYNGTFTGNAVALTNVNQSWSPGRAAQVLSKATVTLNLLNNDGSHFFMVSPSVGYQKDKIAMYWGAYTNANGAATNRGEIHAAFGTSIDNLVEHGVVFGPTNLTDWDGTQTSSPRLFMENGTNFIFYVGGKLPTYEQRPTFLGLAYSTDGTNWTKYSGNPVMSTNPANLYKDVGIGPGMVVRKENTYYLFYAAIGSTAATRENVFLATSQSIFGPWVDVQATPIVLGQLGFSARIATDQCVFPLNDGSYGMIFYQEHATDPYYLLSSSWSRDLRTWTPPAVMTLTTNVGGMNTNIPIGCWVFEDNGPVLVLSDFYKTWLARPDVVGGIVAAGGGGDGDFANPFLEQLTISPTVAGPVGVLKNLSASGYSALDLYDSSSTFVGGMGYGNASAGNTLFRDYTFILSSAKPFMLSVDGVTRNVVVDTSGVLMANGKNVTNTPARPVNNVKHFGATGAFAQDATTYIQAAINAAVINGYPVYFPRGDYSVTDTLTVPAMGATSVTNRHEWLGEGYNITKIYAYAAGMATKNIIRVESDWEAVSGGTMSYFKMSNIGVYGTAYNWGATNYPSMSGLPLSGSCLSLGGGFGEAFTGGSLTAINTELNSCYFGGHEYGVTLTNSQGLVMNDCWVQENAKHNVVMAHVDSANIKNGHYGYVLVTNLAQNAYSFMICGTPGSDWGGSSLYYGGADSGVHKIIEGIEHAGPFLYADGARVTVQGGQFEIGIPSNTRPLTNGWCYLTNFGTYNFRGGTINVPLFGGANPSTNTILFNCSGNASAGLRVDGVAMESGISVTLNQNRPTWFRVVGDPGNNYFYEPWWSLAAVGPNNAGQSQPTFINCVWLPDGGAAQYRHVPPMQLGAIRQIGNIDTGPTITNGTYYGNGAGITGVLRGNLAGPVTNFYPFTAGYVGSAGEINNALLATATDASIRVFAGTGQFVFWTFQGVTGYRTNIVRFIGVATNTTSIAGMFESGYANREFGAANAAMTTTVHAFPGGSVGSSSRSLFALSVETYANPTTPNPAAYVSLHLKTLVAYPATNYSGFIGVQVENYP